MHSTLSSAVSPNFPDSCADNLVVMERPAKKARASTKEMNLVFIMVFFIAICIYSSQTIFRISKARR